MTLPEQTEIIYIWGDPLDFSLSPFFQEHCAILSGNRILYKIFRGGREEFLELLKNERCIGANVTIPHKIHALELCDDLTGKARNAGSVNTIFKSGGRIVGDHTDGAGLVKWLKIKGESLEECAILGNGGSARSIAAALFEEKCSITIFGRTEKGWETKFGSFRQLSDWKNDFPTISTLPFEVQGKNVVTIGYSCGRISTDAEMMLAFQGWLGAKRWFGKTLPAEDFARIVKLHAEAQLNQQLILNLADVNEIQPIS
ncbi:hypothetical protein J6Z19_01280 [bacterium]|nr:hypothetical protein [bacterium]